MDPTDTPERIRARREMFLKFTKLDVIREERRRIRVQLEPSKPKPNQEYYDTWRSEEAQKLHELKEYEYIKEYTDEYKRGPTRPPGDDIAPDDQSKDAWPTNGHERGPTDNGNLPASAARVDPSEKDIVVQLMSLKKQNRVRKFASKPNVIACAGPSASTTTNSYDTPACRVAPVMNTLGPTSTNDQVAFSIFNDFERTSTVRPPTEINEGEFNSNISSHELKRTYFKNYKTNTSLPIYKQRKQIIDSINSYSVVVIEGATGCGKTTQVPMYILEDAILERTSESCAPVIYVTQPRRIAARSIAERVCDEHNWLCPSIVGWQVSLEKQVEPDTVVVFCTAGVLLQKIIQEKSLKAYTHIIIDEAHERDADTDLLMMMIRKLMLTEMPLFRLIIMSATMDIDKLRDYFTFKTNYGHQSETRPAYIHASQAQKATSNMQFIYIDRFKSTLGIYETIPVFDIEQPELFEECLKAAVKIVVEVIPRLDTYNEASKSTLVFLPGLAEISKLDQMIRSYEGNTDGLDIIPLHSCLTVADQLRVFTKSPPGCRKVILATNIAESSITVTDVGFIVDFCLTKTIMKDPVTRFPTLKLLWATQDKCTQRAGRTGRCCPGKVFRMVPQAFFKEFCVYAQPELLTAPLELSVLRVKNFNMGEIKALLAIVMDPPPFNEIRTAVLELKQIGALAATYRGHLSDIDGDLTELGRVISILPIDVRLSKLIVIGSVFDVLQDAIVVAACLSTNRTVVRYMYGNSLDSYHIKLDWARGSQSDLFVSLDCYKEFKELKHDLGRKATWLTSWCNKNYLDERKLHDVDSLVTEITERLKKVNIFADIERPNIVRDSNMDTLMLKVAFCAAFYPNYFLTDNLDTQKVEKELLGGLDPTRTVLFSGLPPNNVPLYKTPIVTPLLDVCDEVEFIAGTSMAYLILKDDEGLCPDGVRQVADALKEDEYHVIQQTRTIPRSVYRALKMAECFDFDVREYQEDAAFQRMLFYDNQRRDFAARIQPRLCPSYMKIVDPGQNPDNSRLLTAEDEEYAAVVKSTPYFEVEFNEEQDAQDQHQLHELEKFETDNKERSLQNELFKSTYKRVRGPDSPIIMKFRSVLIKSKGYYVEVDGQSVNSILLDPEYKQFRRQMLVAAAVIQSKKNRVLARDTTLMPNIRGLPTLMALLFAQYYRLHYNNELGCVAGAVFGIGWTKDDDQPLDRQYEVDLSFDIHITKHDIEMINMARRMMSELLKFTEIQNAGKPQAKLQHDLRQVILNLMRRRRYPLAELDLSFADYPGARENIFTKDVHNMPLDILRDGDTRPFLPLLKYTKDLNELQMYDNIRANLDRLKRIESDEESVPRGGIKCLVCGNGQKYCFIQGLKVEDHLRDPKHLEMVEEFEAWEADARQRHVEANASA